MEGILLIDKAEGSTSFDVVQTLRRITKEKTIGHAGTLDPFATGVLVMLIGRSYTQKSNTFLLSDKTYRAKLLLGIETDSHDKDGVKIAESSQIPTLFDIQKALCSFQGEVLQVPPMFSAKKVGGKKLYELARRGMTIDRQAVVVKMHTTLLSYTYPYLELEIHCSKGTYIRTIAHDLGKILGCGAHLIALTRTASGSFRLNECLGQNRLFEPTLSLKDYLRTV